MPTVEGNVDRLGPSPVQGWARSVDEPAKRLRLRLSLDGQAVGVTTADRYRPDLEAAGVGDGRHAFELDLGGWIDLQAAQELTVECQETGAQVWSGSTAALLHHAARLDRLRCRPLWAVNRLTWDARGLSIGGYLVPPAGGPALDPVWTLDGEPFAHTEFPTASPPAPARLWFVPDHRRLGFQCRSPLAPPAAGGPVPVIDCVDRQTGRPLAEFGAFYVPADWPRQLASLPEAHRMTRVQGHERADVHLLWGHTAVTQFDRLLEQRLGRSVASFASVLDWGCGCGRLTRHLSSVAGPRVTGADIDPDNVTWCRRHLSGPRFETLPLAPPTSLPANEFDLVIGLSVMTHLRHDDQLAWLDELRRVTAPGAVLLLTVNADTAVWWSDPPTAVVDDWQARGFSDRVPDRALDGVIADTDYYRATFHREDYVRRVWGDDFEIVSIEPAFAHIQDLVVLRRH